MVMKRDGTQMTMPWSMLEPAQKLCDRLWPSAGQRVPHEILKLGDDLAGIVIDVDGVDYMLTMQQIPEQRQRPRDN